MGNMKCIRSLFGCGCGSRGGGGQTVLVRALTVAPDQPLAGDLPGTIRTLGSDFIYEVAPALFYMHLHRSQPRQTPAG